MVKSVVSDLFGNLLANLHAHVDQSVVVFYFAFQVHDAAVGIEHAVLKDHVRWTRVWFMRMGRIDVCT